MHFACLSSLLISVVLASLPYESCYMANTNNEYLLVGPVGYQLAADACQPFGSIASINEQTFSPEAMKTYLDLRRGMRSCNNIVKAWVYDKAQIVGKGAAESILPPPIRFLTIHGMKDPQLSDHLNEYWVICHAET